MRRSSVIWVALVLVAAAAPAAAQKGAVIDVQRVLTESDPGKEALQDLQKLQEEKIEEGRRLKQELDALQEQFSKQRLTLSDERLEEMSKEIEDRTITLRRFEDDAQREIDDARRRTLGKLESRILPVINKVGEEQGYELIFNKFQSGLVYAADTVDVTEEVIRRFNLQQ